MVNNITNQNQTIAGAEPTLPPVVDEVTEEKVVRRKLRAKGSIENVRATVGGRAGSRATTMRGGTAQRRGNPGTRSRTENASRAVAGSSRLRSRGLPQFNSPTPGTDLQYEDGSSLESGFKDNGQMFDLLTRADGTSRESVYSFFPNVNGTSGHRVNITEFDASGNAESNKSVSILLNTLGNGSINASAIDFTDPENPIHIYNSNLTPTNVVDDDGRKLYNSRTTNADGSVVTETHEAIDHSSDSYDPEFTHGFKSTITNGSTARVLETKSITNEQGFRVTTVNDITDADNPVLISTDSRPDPFILSERAGGVQLNDYIDHIDQQGFLNISGSDKATPQLDLILIHRYNKGERGADLFADLDLSGATKTQTEIEAKLAEGTSRGIYDVDGSGSQAKINGEVGANPVSTFDMDFLARYMMGARDSALIDDRFADDDSINIAADGSNVISLDNNSPILSEMQEIFGVEGRDLNSGDNGIKLFYINLSRGASLEGSSGRILRSNQSAPNSPRRTRRVDEGGTFIQRQSSQAINRLGDQTADFFENLE